MTSVARVPVYLTVDDDGVNAPPTTNGVLEPERVMVRDEALKVPAEIFRIWETVKSSFIKIVPKGVKL